MEIVFFLFFCINNDIVHYSCYTPMDVQYTFALYLGHPMFFNAARTMLKNMGWPG